MVLKHWKKPNKALTLLHQEMLEGMQPKQSENNSKSK